MRVAVLGAGPSSIQIAAMLSECRPGVVVVDIEATPLMDPWEFLREPDVNPYFSLDDILWDAMCPREFIKELSSAILPILIATLNVQPFFREHYDDE